MILRIVLIVLAFAAGLLVLAAIQPKRFRIERSVSIKAPADKIFALVDDFHNWPQWAQQDREDPAMKRNYEGADRGVGAESAWAGKGEAGAGRMRITESVPFKQVSVHVDFERPFEAHNLNQFRLEPDGTATKVTWTMDGTSPYVLRLMSLFVNLDRMMGKHFESGLRNLKDVAER